MGPEGRGAEEAQKGGRSRRGRLQQRHGIGEPLGAAEQEWGVRRLAAAPRRGVRSARWRARCAPEDRGKPGLGVPGAGGGLRERWQGLPCSSPRDSAALPHPRPWPEEERGPSLCGAGPPWAWVALGGGDVLRGSQEERWACSGTSPRD